MTGHRIFSKDKHGLTQRWFDVPQTKELPTFYGLTAKERRAMTGRHLDIQQQKAQYEATVERKNRSGGNAWNKHRSDKERQNH